MELPCSRSANSYPYRTETLYFTVVVERITLLLAYEVIPLVVDMCVEMCILILFGSRNAGMNEGENHVRRLWRAEARRNQFGYEEEEDDDSSTYRGDGGKAVLVRENPQLLERILRDTDYDSRS